MTHQVDTADDKTFSEPPVLTVAEGRTHCNACGATLDASVMHKCHGNEEWEPPVLQASQPDLSAYKGVCPKCHGGRGLIINADTGETPVCDLCQNTGEVK